MQLSLLDKQHNLGRVIRNAALSNQDTYDLPHLNRFDYHPLFVYGTLKSTESRNSALDPNGSSEYLANCVTVDRMMMWQRNAKDNFPIIFDDLATDLADDFKPYVASVVGELWHVSTETLISIDAIEGNPDVFTRKPIKAQVLSKVAGSDYQLFETVTIWAYVGNKSFWYPETKAGTIRPMAKANDKLEYKSKDTP